MSLTTQGAEPARRDSGRRELALRVVDVAPAAEGIVLVRFESPDGARLPEWKPGDHLEIVLPSSLIRHYSLCGDAADRASYTVAVLRVADGRGGSREIHDTDLAGATLKVRGPRSTFPMAPADSYLLLAGGIGITPLYAMARELSARGAQWSMVYGARSASAMVFRPELTRLGEDRVQFVAQDTGGLPDLEGPIRAAADGTAVYCCGPTPMIRRVEELCATWPDRLSLHVERFGGAGSIAEADGSDHPFDLVLADTGLTLHVPADRTALEVVHDVLPDHPYSCLGGQCGSCEVEVLAGEVEHRDEVLSDEEKEQNSAMTLCVSRARSERLVIRL
jgi:ferredoxin-NADP reductase